MELYIHIPFCIRKCAYCDFLSGPADVKTQDLYMKALLKEVELAGVMHRRSGKAGIRQWENGLGDERNAESVDTIFIGGGTPSAIDARWIVRLMEQVRTSFIVADDAEITMEANPGTLTADKLEQYRQAGINRLSIGLQSTDDGELARLGRIHTYAEFLENYRLAREAGFTNINIDLMSALPGQTVESYENTLRRVIALAPEHISAYSLIIEEGTPFGERYGQEEGRYDGRENGKIYEGAENVERYRETLWKLPTEDEDRQMYHLTKEILAEFGYERYEISNYARPGHECRHNVGYWKRVPYLGLGLGAASYYQRQRFANTREMKEYLQILELGGEDPKAYLEQLRQDVCDLSRQDAMEEFMFLGLRLTEGVSEEDFRQQFGEDMTMVYGSVLEKMGRQGLLTRKTAGSSEDAAEEPDTIWQLTDLGLDVSNYVLAEFLL